jgi:hypothetical protein
MLKSVAGMYRDGKIELAEVPVNVPNETSVIVTFLETGPINSVRWTQPTTALIPARDAR